MQSKRPFEPEALIDDSVFGDDDADPSSGAVTVEEMSGSHEVVAGA